MRSAIFLMILTAISPFASAASFDGCFEQAAVYHYVNPRILRAIARVESGFNPGIIHRNANGTVDVGIMQINSSWYRTLGAYGIRPAHLLDPCVNIFVGAWILSGDIREYGNTWRAIGKYNAAGDRAGAVYAQKIYRAVLKENVQ